MLRVLCCYECCEGSVLLYNLILKNESDIVSVMSVVTVMGVVSVIRGVEMSVIQVM